METAIRVLLYIVAVLSLYWFGTFLWINRLEAKKRLLSHANESDKGPKQGKAPCPASKKHLW